MRLPINFEVPPRTKRQRETIKRRFPNLLSDVARIAGVSRPTVTIVFQRKRKSARIVAILAAEIRRRLAESEVA